MYKQTKRKMETREISDKQSMCSSYDPYQVGSHTLPPSISLNIKSKGNSFNVLSEYSYLCDPIIQDMS